MLTRNGRFRASLLASLAGVAAITTLSACSPTSPGTPTADTADTTSVSRASSTNSASASNAVSSLNPCELLTADQATQLGLPGTGQPEKIVKARGCVWNASGLGSARVSLNNDLGLEDLNTASAKSPPEPLTIGSHQAIRFTSMARGCDLGLGIGEKSRAFIVVQLVDGTTEQACQLSTKIATFIEPKLPKS
jgi:hypothetical protein